MIEVTEFVDGTAVGPWDVDDHDVTRAIRRFCFSAGTRDARESFLECSAVAAKRTVDDAGDAVVVLPLSPADLAVSATANVETESARTYAIPEIVAR